MGDHDDWPFETAEPADAVNEPGASQPMRGPVLLAVGAAVIVLVLVVAVVVSSDPDDDPFTIGRDPTAATTIKKNVAPSGPGADPALADGGDAKDSFERTGGLGEFPDVGPWKVGRGTWRTASSAAAVVASEPKGLNVAWVDTGTANVRAQVMLPDLTDGAGLAFRVVDKDNFWLWAPSPGYATVRLVRVKDGKAKGLGNSGVTITRPGMTIGVHVEGSRVELLANGVVVLTVRDDSNAKARGTGLGLGAGGGRSDRSFDDLVFSRGP